MTMTDEAITTCPHCAAGVRAGDLVRRVGEVEVYRCPQCGRTIEIAVLREGDLPPARSSYSVTLSWGAERSAARVASALRRLLPEFAERSMAEARARVAGGEDIVVHELNESDANDLVARARRLGLTVERRGE